MPNPFFFLTYEDFAAISPGEGFKKICPPPYRNLPEGVHTGGPWLSPDGTEVWNGSSPGGYASREMAANFAAAGDPEADEIRARFMAELIG